jgi:membrane associated rhomboid family serine protease
VNQRGAALRTPGVAWLGVAGLLAAGALAVTAAMAAVGQPHPGNPLPSAFDWQPGLTWLQPWRPWTCAWVHWSWPHLVVNLAGTAVVAGVGWRARAPLAAAVAWLLAWPLTHLVLAWEADALSQVLDAAQPMQHYGGLSGVLHAGVVVLGLAMALPAAGAAVRDQAAGLVPLTAIQVRRHRLVGTALVAGTLAKVLLEAPWEPALRASALLGIGVAPLAHASGFMAGAAAGITAWAIGRQALPSPR